VIFTDVYVALNLWYEMKRKKMTCCLSVFYVWLLSRVAEKDVGVQCPVEEVLQRRLQVKGPTNWIEFFSGLTQEKIKWCSSWQQRSSIIYHCRNYPNVPLIGTKGCINYNPVLAQRQLEYPIRGSPTPASLTTLLIYYKEEDATEVLRHTRNAWKSVILMKWDSRAWVVDREIPYRQLITERVKKVKLPFIQISTCLRNEEQMQNEETEEVRLLKGQIRGLKEENTYQNS